MNYRKIKELEKELSIKLDKPINLTNLDNYFAYQRQFNDKSIKLHRNHIPLDPKICIFTPLMGDLKVNGATVFDSNPLPLNRSKYSQYKGIDNMKKFAVKSQVNDILYGKLMNV